MADPLLTSLCTICHVQSPKYKCPRCATRTCSLACIKKHKNWSSCSGERDPTVYLPPSKLKTDAGIDHDYNFLTKIERSVEAAEKRFREERDILPPPGQGPQQQEQNEGARNGGGRGGHQPNKRARFNNGRGGDRHHNNNAHGENAMPTRRWDKNSQYRLRKLGIQVTAVPYGMTRSRENKTSWNKRTKTMNWQVEWFVWNSAAGTNNPSSTAERSENAMDIEGDDDATRSSKPTRILHKILDEVPIAEGFKGSLSWFRHNEQSEAERLAEKSVKKNTTTTTQQHGKSSDDKTSSFGQDYGSATWSTHLATSQSPATGAWNIPLSMPTSSEADGKYQFFYHHPRIPSRQTQKLRPLSPAESLATILPGLEIVEFPAIHVLPIGMALPAGYMLEEKEPMQFAMRPRPPPVVVENGTGRTSGKRKADEIVGYGSSDEESEDENGEEDEEAADTTSSEEEESEEEEESGDEEMATTVE